MAFINFSTSARLCGFERFLVLRQSRQEHAEAMEQVERGGAVLRQPGTGHLNTKNRRLRESQRSQRSAKERVNKAAPATAINPEPIIAMSASETVPVIAETAIKTFTWRQQRPLRR